MKDSFLSSLCESRLFSSKQAVTRYSARQLADLTHLYCSALAILRMSPSTEKWAREYARKTIKENATLRWRNDATDLGVMVVSLMDETVQLRLPKLSDDLRSKILLDEKLLVQWLKNVASPKMDKSLTTRFFMKLDIALKVTDSSMTAIRRLAQTWDTLDTEEASLSMTRLLQMLRNDAPRCEILVPLQDLSTRYGLELKNVCNLETGEGCGEDNEAVSKDDAKKPKKSFLSTITGLAIGGTLGYNATTKFNEDATDGATSSGDIAAVSQPLLPIQRRYGQEVVIKPKKKPK